MRLFSWLDGELTYQGTMRSSDQRHRLSEETAQRGGLVFQAYAMTTSRRAGLWACTAVEWAGEMLVDDVTMGAGLTPWDDHPPQEPYDRVLREFWGLETSLPRPKNIEALSAIRYWRTREPNISGYLLNTATLLGLGMFLCFAPLTIRDAWRAWRFRGAATCKSCGYDLRGLAPNTAVCPECGTPLPS